MDNCRCSVVDFDEGPIFYRSDIRRSRKQYRCEECGSSIEVGTRYEYVVAKWSSDFETFRTCLTCVNIRRDLFPCGFFHGEMRKDIWECLGVDYVSGEIDDR